MKGRVLIIAGSDSGGGAGIQADIKTVTAFGGYAMTAITAITVQNTLGVFGVHLVPLEIIASQMRVVLEDIGADVLKTFAVSRLLLDNVDHVKNFWVMHGLSTAALSLSFGADDLDGSVVEYKITHDADHYGTPSTMTREDLLEIIRDAGFTPAAAKEGLIEAVALGR